MAKDRKTKRTEGVSRRLFFGDAGKLAAGVAVGVAGLSWTACSNQAAASSSQPTARPAATPAAQPTVAPTEPPKPTPKPTEAAKPTEAPKPTTQPAAQATGAAAGWPWPYKKVDPAKVSQRGHDGYFKYACCEGAFEAITGELGAPFTSVPHEMFKFGEGGVAGWGNLCGALNGSLAAIGLVHGQTEVTTKLVNEMMSWYAEKHGSGSTLCHVSVTEWCKKTGNKAESKERKERCATVCGETAAHAVELMNQQADGTFKATYTPPAKVVECLNCHGTKGMENTRGKMECVPCHTPHKT